MIRLNRSNVSGSYVGIQSGLRLELRIDVGNADSLDVLSGDVMQENGGGNLTFHHSFQTTALMLEEDASAQIVRGAVKVHRDNFNNIGRIDLIVPEQGDLVARYTLYRQTNFGRVTDYEFTFALQRQSTLFRRVDLEIESVQGVPFPRPFRTSDHPDTPPEAQNQTLTLRMAYRVAGVDLNVIHGGEQIPVSAAGPDSRWTDEELHAAMVNHFDRHRDAPQWRLYMLLATEYVSPDVLGIMFDAASSDAFHRQGAAIFHDYPSIGAASGAEKDREYLFTIVHELGHAFNFLHSFQKGIFETHGVLPRPDAMSWMNYPQLFPFGFAGPTDWDGSSQFWSQFEFGFDRDEIHHLRHDDRAEVIPGGARFGSTGHFEERPFAQQTRDAGMRLDLWTPCVVEFLQQIEGDVRLRNDGADDVAIPPSLDPAAGHLELLIRRPTDRFPRVYQHFSSACVRASTRTLAPSEAVYQEITPSFGRRQWFFDEPGTYELQAVAKMPDGRRIVSNLQKVRILTPDREADRLAPDFFTDDTGVYLGVDGSRCAKLAGVADMLSKVQEQVPDSAISQQISIANALRDTRIFKDVAEARVVRPKRSEAAARCLKAISVIKEEQTIKPREGLSNLRVSRALLSCVYGCFAEDNLPEAKRVLGLSNDFLKQVKAPKSAREEFDVIAGMIGG